MKQCNIDHERSQCIIGLDEEDIQGYLVDYLGYTDEDATELVAEIVRSGDLKELAYSMFDYLYNGDTFYQAIGDCLKELELIKS